MKKKFSLVLIAFLCAVFFGYGQLSPGDIAFVQYNADGTDNFAFVALTNIAETETIYFTDNEENSLSGTEGTITWIPPTGGVTCGTIITIDTAPSASVGTVSETNDLNFAVGGDSVLAYQGTTAAPTFLAALSNDGGSWGGAADGNLPAGLTNGVTAIAISPEVDNCALDIADPTSNTQANLLTIINDNSNWTLTNNTSQQTFTDTIVISDCVHDTRVEFTTIAYSAGENNASIDLCVDIFNESSSSDTSVDVVLITGSAPHITYTTQTLTFPMSSSLQQCVTIPISQNAICGDTTSYTFELQSVSGGDSAFIGTNDETTLTVNDDDGTVGPFRTLSFEPGDDWTYTTAGGSISSIPNKFFGTQSYQLGGSNQIITDNIDISPYTNVSLSVAFASLGTDNGDDLFLDISYDNGVTWTGTGSIKLMDGYSNANLNVGDTNASDPTTVATNPWVVNIAPTETQIKVRLRGTSLGGGEYYYVDDIILSGDTCVIPCTPTHSVLGFTPTSGPVGTEVAITGTGFTALTEVKFDGINAASITFIDANTLIAEVPTGSSTGIITVTEAACDVDSTEFTVILNDGNCGSLNQLIMTEIYDHDGGSLGYIEVYNGTGATINLTNYFIRRYGSNTNYLANDFTDYAFAPGVTTIADGAVIYGKISSDADVATPDFNYGNAGFSGINGDDIFELRNSTGVIDVYQVPNNNIGFTARRSVTTAGPNSTSPGGNPTDWTHNTTESTADLGLFPFVGLSNFPVVNTSPSDVTMCSPQAVFTATASPSASGTLTYQWYYNEGDGVATGWTIVSPGDFPLATISGEASNQLTIGYGFANYNNYQFYCLVTEDGACSTASDAAQIKLDVAIWSSSGWSSSPSLDKMVIIDHPYDTTSDGSFQACQLTINATNTLNLRDGFFVEVVNDVIVNGNIIMETESSFVQHNDLASTRGDVLTDKTKIQVKKKTAILNSYQEYTYWSSPVIGETIQDGLYEASNVRRFYFDSRYYNDSCAESSNDNNLVCDDGMGGTLQDDVDDEGDDWNYAAAASVMQPGVGYASTHAAIGYINPARYDYIFEGPFNNGEIQVPIYRNDSEMADNNWNFIGNPYPSAVSAVDFLGANASINQNAGSGAITGALFFWSHDTSADGGTNGNEAQNYSQSDYAIYNGAGGRAGGDGVIPDPYIPSGQGFFISMANGSPSTAVSGFPNVRTTDIVFNNSMRVTGNNDQFFRLNNSAFENEKLWINLTTDNGVFNQSLVAYVDGATNADDGMYYDAYNLSSNVNAMLYSLIPNSDKKYAIQGKAPSSLSINEIIPLGFYNTIEDATLYTISIAQFEGAFLTENNIYIKDKLMNIVHNLSDNDYSFTSDSGEFNNRFEIVFQAEALSISENQIDSNGLSITEIADGNVKFSVGQQFMITQVDIIDIVGRTVYMFKGNNSEEVFNLSGLSQSAYIAKVTLSNGQVITKKAIKSN